MIAKMSLLHYPSEAAYKSICRKLGLDGDDSKTAGELSFPNEFICGIHPFNILYERFGQICFLSVDLDMSKFKAQCADFEKTLFDAYLNIFGEEAMADFPAYKDIYCNYIEYADVLRVDSADQIINTMSASGCPPEQLDEAGWPDYQKPHGTIAFCVSKVDGTHIKTLARCHGTALQKLVKDKSLHRAGAGISVSKMIGRETEDEIMGWLYARYKISAN
jgi:hypothetical protein